MTIFPSFITKNGIARTNRFVVNIVPPVNLLSQSGNRFASTYINAFRDIPIERAELPGLSINTTEYKFDQQPTFNVPQERKPAGIAVITFILDEKHQARQKIEEWIETIINVPIRPSGVIYSKNYYNEITGTVQIIQLGIDLKPSFGIQLLNAFPIAIDNVQLDWGEMDQYSRLNVTFSYFDSMKI